MFAGVGMPGPISTIKCHGQVKSAPIVAESVPDPDQLPKTVAKRLFLWAAESAGHDWFSRLTPQRVDLGKGKRSLFRGGRYDPKYRITVPKQEEADHV